MVAGGGSYLYRADMKSPSRRRTAVVWLITRGEQSGESHQSVYSVLLLGLPFPHHKLPGGLELAILQ